MRTSAEAYDSIVVRACVTATSSTASHVPPDRAREREGDEPQAEWSGLPDVTCHARRFLHPWVSATCVLLLIESAVLQLTRDHAEPTLTMGDCCYFQQIPVRPLASVMHR